MFKGKRNIRIKAFITLISCSLTLVIGNMVVYMMIHRKIGYYVKHISPVILVMAVCILLLFRDAKCDFLAKPLMLLSTISFDVYIIHCHIWFFDFIIKDAFLWIGKLKIYLIPFTILACGIGIFLLCSLISLIRLQLFKVARLDLLISKISKKLDSFLYTGI